jgi:hypothetical protein
VAAAYALGDDAHRARYAGFVSAAAETVSVGQMANGSWEAMTGGKVWQAGNPRDTSQPGWVLLYPDQVSAMGQAIEHGILCNGVAAMANVTGDPRFYTATKNAALGLVRYWWLGNTGGPTAILGTRPQNASLPVYMSRAEVPPHAVLPGIDGWMIGSTLGYGLMLTPAGSPEHAEIVDATRKYVGATNESLIVPRLAGQGMQLFVESRAPLHAALTGATWGGQ